MILVRVQDVKQMNAVRWKRITAAKPNLARQKQSAYQHVLISVAVIRQRASMADSMTRLDVKLVRVQLLLTIHVRALAAKKMNAVNCKRLSALPNPACQKPNAYQHVLISVTVTRQDASMADKLMRLDVKLVPVWRHLTTLVRISVENLNAVSCEKFRAQPTVHAQVRRRNVSRTRQHNVRISLTVIQPSALTAANAMPMVAKLVPVNLFNPTVRVSKPIVE
jgi:hypothetical protein